MTPRRMSDVYLKLEILDTPFRRDRLMRMGWEIYARGGGSPLTGGHQIIWVHRRRRLTVMEGREHHLAPGNNGAEHGAVWHHLSMSHADRLPTWDEFSEAKRVFMGDTVEAYLVHPPSARYVNINPRVLHWYACMDRPSGVLPDFRVDGASELPGQVGI